jgi:RHS repeat-associated protein
VSGKRAYIYDGHRLLEEYEIGAQSSTLRSRYYYADEAEVPVAAHFLDPQTNLLVLHFFVVDRVGSVHGVLDEAGNWVERVRYDAWGRPTIELPDHAVPVIHEIKVEHVTRDILVVFTEPVLPAADAQAAPAIASVLEGLTGSFELHVGTDTIPVTITYDEMNPNYARGTVLRLAIDPIDRPADGTSVELEVMGNRLFDRWSNAAGSEQFEIDYEEGYSYPGANQGSTGPQTISESRVGNVLFFQSHFYDDDADLVHMRARMFNPATGMFLQRDPFGYEDSVNLYAGLKNNPINVRDPTGAVGQVVAGAAAGGIIFTGLEGWRQIATGQYSGRRLLAAGVGGAIFGGLAAATFGGSIAAGGAITVSDVVAGGAIGVTAGSARNAVEGTPYDVRTATGDFVAGI